MNNVTIDVENCLSHYFNISLHLMMQSYFISFNQFFEREISIVFKKTFKKFYMNISFSTIIFVIFFDPYHAHLRSCASSHLGS
jgi:hypothetical protein